MSEKEKELEVAMTDREKRTKEIEKRLNMTGMTTRAHSLKLSLDLEAFILSITNHHSKIAVLTEMAKQFAICFSGGKKALENINNQSVTAVNDKMFSFEKLVAYCQNAFPQNNQLIPKLQEKGFTGASLLKAIKDSKNADFVNGWLWQDDALGAVLKTYAERFNFHSFFEDYIVSEDAEVKKEGMQLALKSLIGILNNKNQEKQIESISKVEAQEGRLTRG